MKKRLQNWLTSQYGWVLSFMILAVVVLQIVEYLLVYPLYFNVVELILYIILIVVAGVFIDLLVRSMVRQSHSLNILTYRQRINQEVMAHEDWESLTISLVNLAAEVAPVDEVLLYIHNPVLNQYKLTAHWSDPARVRTALGSPKTRETLEDFKKGADTTYSSQYEGRESDLAMADQEHCFPIEFANRPLALLRIIDKPSAKITADQREIFNNLSEAMAIALKAAQDRQALLEMRVTETSMEVRRKFSQFLHDNLGPNLGYMRLKLDQLIDEEDTLTQEDLHKDLDSLRTAALDSNKILRGMLETIQPETTPVLTNMLCEYARKVSQRTKFKVDFVIQGKPLAITQEIGQTVFFAFQELLSNVEKYSAASQVDVNLNWGDDNLEMTVSDNGKGFDLQSINHKQHFGLEIMQERISRVSGQMNLVTAANKGTKVTISLPSPYQERVSPTLLKG